MRSPDLALVGRSDLSLEDIQNYTHFWETKFNQSRNTRSTTEISYKSTKEINEINDIKVTERTTQEESQSSNSNQQKGFHRFKEIFNVIIELKKLNNELKTLAMNSVHKHSVSLKHNKEELPENLTVENEDEKILNDEEEKNVLSLREFSGVIDLKISGRDGFRAAAGPPYSISHGSILVKPFQWSKSPIKDLPHIGQSDVWEYSPVQTDWVWL